MITCFLINLSKEKFTVELLKEEIMRSWTPIGGELETIMSRR